ncbi:MAG: class I tRNA ligase family protein [bacterium]
MSDNKEAEQDFDFPKSALAQKEEETMAFWQTNNIFEKALAKESPKGEYVFYDGPPFATGLPHYGHLLAGTIKDVIPRYRTMCGFHVDRKWGWDCHGLPVENIVEKELGLKSKKDIEDYGLKDFNERARSSVMRYADEWKKIVPRVGRWVNMEQDYRTINSSYTESVWWIFRTLHEKGLVYEGFKSMHLCPHCGTTLSNFEVAQGYKDITDITATAKFELADERGAYVLAWTTTPWTLPGNVALAINPDIDYVKVKVGAEFYILAESRLSVIKDTYELVEKFNGQTLVGKKYIPLFDYYTKPGSDIKNLENGFKIYPASFVTTEDGTGVVHIAPAFGEDDLNLGKEYKMPFIQHVSYDGKMRPEVTEFAGQYVKPIDTAEEKEKHMSMDIAMIKHLAGKNQLFAKEKVVHSYPHCWRCDTPLLNYATSSWFVEVTKMRDSLLKANNDINWVTKEIGEGRFGKWLEGARDWAISRSRYWGAPLPIWRCEDCKAIKVIGGVEDLKKTIGQRNEFLVVRHGQSESNVKKILSAKVDDPNPLTALGREQARETAMNLKKEKIDMVFASPFVRTKETVEIIADMIGFSKDKIIFDKRLSEINVGVMDGKTDAEYQAYFGSREEKFHKVPEGGESHTDVKNRMVSFLYDINSKYSGKKILIVTHNTPGWLMFAGAAGMTPDQAIAMRHEAHDFIKNAEVKKLDFTPIPHNDNYELDLHRPYIDEVKIPCACGEGKEMKRVPEVFDCWFESGSMPYAQWHYPYENLDKFNPEPGFLKKAIGFPAEFIGEGLDQTRGWFYSMLVIAVGLFGKSSFKNVVVNGIVLAEDGQKMSKRLKNYPDPMLVVSKYGADALRYYLLSSPVVKAEDLRFSEKGVDEVVKKIIMRLQNVHSFYEMYKGEKPLAPSADSTNVLDRWILARLKELTATVTKGLENYELDRAARPFGDFVDDLSTWYLRRSRDRFKSDVVEDRDQGLMTTRYVLLEMTKLLAPIMPFVSETLYQSLKTETDKESVHLADWPKATELNSKDTELLGNMFETRRLVSVGLEMRAKAGQKVRQPLASMTVKDKTLAGKDDFLNLIIDEVNVKAVLFDDKLDESTKLDLNITDELKLEGNFRDLLRQIQEMRKTTGLNPGEIAKLTIETDDAGKTLVTLYQEEIKKTATVEIDFGTVEGEVLKVGESEFKLKLVK